MSDSSPTHCYRIPKAPRSSTPGSAPRNRLMWWEPVVRTWVEILVVVATIGCWIVLRPHIPVFFEVIRRSPILFIFYIIILPLLWGFLGKGLGITSLFWNDSPWTRVSAAGAVTIYLAVVATLMFLSSMIEPERMLSSPPPDAAKVPSWFHKAPAARGVSRAPRLPVPARLAGARACACTGGRAVTFSWRPSVRSPATDH